MSLIEICCPRCQHRGFIAADRLPGVLTCSDCGLAELVRQGGHVVRSYDADRLNGADNGRKPPTRWQHKRALTPRVPVTCKPPMHDIRADATVTDAGARSVVAPGALDLI